MSRRNQKKENKPVLLKKKESHLEDLTPIQTEIWAFIKNHVEEYGFPPTLRELGDAFEIASTNGVRYHLRILSKKGYIEHRKGTRRGLCLRNPDGSSPFQKYAVGETEIQVNTIPDNVVSLPERKIPDGFGTWWKPLPIIGRVAAGLPNLAEEHEEDEIGVDQALFGGGPNVELFGLRIEGNSMFDMGIYEGDLAVVRKQRTARSGEIVVATVNDEATVKRYLPETERIVLKPENADYEPIIVTPEDRFRIVGIVVGIIRRKVQ
jgi:repressor LexA